MLMKVKALEGDTVDSLCFRYYGTTQAEHLPEPKPRLPSSEGGWSHVFQDVTWGESDG
ncbi:hypothetical protein C4N87_000145 [Escherichia coli]|nr:hypothetical protein [Escherichia coli]EFM4999841.1 hypothetical protein [Escherichia coli]EFM8484159.1 hypothetical protein [Escherichia coli]EFW8049795.1 hypothetical protein [Shigella sonnei]EGL8377920.1 hypothetical protein [Escherichia coli]